MASFFRLFMFRVLPSSLTHSPLRLPCTSKPTARPKMYPIRLLARLMSSYRPARQRRTSVFSLFSSMFFFSIFSLFFDSLLYPTVPNPSRTSPETSGGFAARPRLADAPTPTSSRRLASLPSQNQPRDRRSAIGLARHTSSRRPARCRRNVYCVPLVCRYVVFFT